MGHAYTREEILQQINVIGAQIVETQSTQPTLGTSLEQRLQGAILQTLQVFDGLYGGDPSTQFPLCIVSPHEDQDYINDAAASGYDWWPASELAYGVELGGSLSASYEASL